MIYSADEYIALLNTYSGHRAFDDETRERLLSRIHRADRGPAPNAPCGRRTSRYSIVAESSDDAT